MQSTQIAACNRLHEVEERLARWILMGRLHSDHLPLTQDFLAQMQGSRRPSVTVAAGIVSDWRLALIDPAFPHLGTLRNALTARTSLV